jgi:hypothetical protein
MIQIVPDQADADQEKKRRPKGRQRTGRTPAPPSFKPVENRYPGSTVDEHPYHVQHKADLSRDIGDLQRQEKGIAKHDDPEHMLQDQDPPGHPKF